MSLNQQDEHGDGIVEDRKKAPPIYFYVLFYGLILWAVIFSGYYLFSGWSSDQEFQTKMQAYNTTYSSEDPVVNAPKNVIPPAASIAPSGAKLFAANCAGCHGAEGKGGFGSDLTGSYTYGKDPAAVHESISGGRGGKMPSFAGRLTPAEIDSLVAYILQL